jgi:hypothetical protein
MTSKNKDTRAAQIEKYQGQLEKKKADLEKECLKAEEINKDKTVKHLKAEIRRTKNAIAFIENREKTLQKAKKAKADKANKPATDKKDKKIKKEEPKEEKSKKSKKKKSE